MKKIIALSLLLVCPLLSAQVNENGELEKYRRSSLYSVLIEHPGIKFSDQISAAFLQVPIPEKFNDHNLTQRQIESSAKKARRSGKQKDNSNLADAEAFINEQKIANQMVAKWFNRNASTGGFNMNLIQERGFYDASKVDIIKAELNERGLAVLGDAGEELIGKTFLLVNDITYVDKGEVSAGVATGLSIAANLAGSLLGSSSISRLGNLAAAATNEIDGFTVEITSYLYRLKWDEETMGTFYKNYWFPENQKDEAKKAAFDNSDAFKLEYVGQSKSSAGILSSKNFSKISKEDQMIKACTRAVDKSIVELQREYDEFKVNVPITSISNDKKTVEVKIGLKEGINEKSEFAVLSVSEDKNGKVSYHEVGRLKPVKGQIWDNRFGALEEAQMIEAAKKAGEKVKAGDIDLKAASLTSTTFKVMSGAGQIYPGCLIREVTIKTK